MSTDRKIGEWRRDLFKQSMTSSGKEERDIVSANNSYHQGIPAVTVIVDGGWSKRTHKHSYNAKSGVAIIIGKAILYMGVHNKFCSICNRHPEQPPPHTFFKIGMVLLLPWKLILLLKTLRNVNSSMPSDTPPSLVMEIFLFIPAL